MSIQRESFPTSAVQPNLSRVSVGQFAERFRGEVIPLSNTFGYFCASVPFSEELLKEYLEEPVAALPPVIATMLPRISVLFVPYLERGGSAKKASKILSRKTAILDKRPDFVCAERPEEGRLSWASQVSFDDETVLVFALKEQDVAEYHYRFYRHLAAMVADKWSEESRTTFASLLCDELNRSVHGEVDEESWASKQTLLRRKESARLSGAAFDEYLRQSFIDTLTLYLHGVCCDIDVDTGPRQLPSRYLRKRLQALRTLYPPPAGYAVFPEEQTELEAPPRKAISSPAKEEIAE